MKHNQILNPFRHNWVTDWLTEWRTVQNRRTGELFYLRDVKKISHNSLAYYWLHANQLLVLNWSKGSLSACIFLWKSLWNTNLPTVISTLHSTRAIHISYQQPATIIDGSRKFSVYIKRFLFETWTKTTTKKHNYQSEPKRPPPPLRQTKALILHLMIVLKTIKHFPFNYD